MIDIYIYDIDQDLEKQELMLAYLPPKIQDKIKRYHEINSYQLSLLGWYKLCKCLKEQYNLNITNDTFCFNQNNKPYILNNPIYFNISHSLNLVAVVIADFEVGIDIEQISECHHIDKFKRFLKTGCSVNNLELIKAWTVYEAKVKCLGISIFNKDNLDDKNFTFINTKIVKDKQNNQYFLTICKK